MKKIVYFLVLISLFACQKEINIDLNNASPRIVIEGEINDQTEVQTVTISQTANFSSPNVFPKISGAEVTIADNAGNSEKLTETSAGIYQTRNMKGVENRTYYLTIKIGSQTYTSECTMPLAVSFTGINLLKRNLGFGSSAKEAFVPIPQFVDPANLQNQYRFIQYRNGDKDDNIIIRNDNIANGLPNQQPLFSNDFEIVKGDSLQVEMHCITKSVYDYFYSLNQSSGRGPGGGTTPSNPVSNISGGALGYFSAYTVRTRGVLVK